MTMKKCSGPCKLTKSLSEFHKDSHTKSGLTSRCAVCRCVAASRQPTGYKKGRPRKGEIRPETPGGKQKAEWREKNHERSLEINRASTAKLLAEDPNYPERVRNYLKAYYLRKKGWAGTKLSVATDAVVVDRKNPKQVILVQVDA